MTSRQAENQEDTHFRIMRILLDNPNFTRRELTEMLGMSVGWLKHCLNALIDKGFMKSGNFQKGKSKFKHVDLLTLQSISGQMTLASRFFKRKTEEYEALKVEIELLTAEAENKRCDVPNKALNGTNPDFDLTGVF
jgi:EPS-associated MarR family transcriptional regulator